MSPSLRCSYQLNNILLRVFFLLFFLFVCCIQIRMCIVLRFDVFIYYYYEYYLSAITLFIIYCLKFRWPGSAKKICYVGVRLMSTRSTIQM